MHSISYSTLLYTVGSITLKILTSVCLKSLLKSNINVFFLLHINLFVPDGDKNQVMNAILVSL